MLLYNYLSDTKILLYTFYCMYFISLSISTLYRTINFVKMKAGENFFKVTKLLMLVAGTWDLELTTFSKTCQTFYKVYSVITFIIYYSLPIALLIKLCEFVGDDNEKAVECLSMLIIIFLLGIKMALCRRREMSLVLKNAMEKVNAISMDDDEYIKTVYSTNSFYALTLSTCLTLWTFFVGLFLTVGAVFETLEFRRTHDLLDKDIEMPLQVLCWYPFDVRKHYILVLEYQFYSILLADVYNSALLSLTNTVMIQIKMDIKVLQHRFRNFAKDFVTGKRATEEKAYLNLKECIKSHQKLIEHNEELNNVMKYALLAEYTVSSIMLASILVQILQGKKPFFNSIYFGILAFQWCVLSWNANEILVQSEELSMALYESDWYNCSKPIHLLVIIVMLRIKKPLFLNIGPFGALTFDATMSRLKVAYSYISIMS